MNDSRLFSAQFTLSPGECNAEKEMPLWLIAERIIALASNHADTWGIGFKDLAATCRSWVLSRLAIEIDHYPKVGETYTMTTWIESYNRHFSERNVEILDSEGKPFGYSRSVWFVMDMNTRQSSDISDLSCMSEKIIDHICPIAKQSRFKTVNSSRQTSHIFQYSDIDYNRHVNSVSYIRLLLNQWNLAFYDSHRISRFEISYLRECLPGKQAIVRIDESNSNDCMLEISCNEEVVCKARIQFQAQ